MRTFARSHRRSATRAARRCPPGLPLHKVLAVVVLIPHASRLRYFALDAPIRKAAFVDPVEHRAHRRRGHPVEVPEHDLAALGRHLEPTVVPLFRVDDRRALRQGSQGNRLRELLQHGRKRTHRSGEELPDVAVTPVAEFRLDDFEELRARLDRKPRVFRELVRIDRPRSDRLGHDAATARLPQVLQESHDARAPDLRHEPFLGGLSGGRGDVAPRPVQFAEEGRPVRREAVQPHLTAMTHTYFTAHYTSNRAHTFLFLFAILALSFVPMLPGLRLVGFGVASHLLLDLIWNQPAVVWYPAYGWSFPMAPFDAARWLDTLLHDPYVQAGEIVGLAVLIAFAWTQGIASWKALRDFVRHGTLPRSGRTQLQKE